MSQQTKHTSNRIAFLIFAAFVALKLIWSANSHLGSIIPLSWFKEKSSPMFSIPATCQDTGSIVLFLKYNVRESFRCRRTYYNSFRCYFPPKKIGAQNLVRLRKTLNRLGWVRVLNQCSVCLQERWRFYSIVALKLSFLVQKLTGHQLSEVLLGLVGFWGGSGESIFNSLKRRKVQAKW